MDIARVVSLLRGTLQPEERVDAEKQLIEVGLFGFKFCLGNSQV